MLGSQTRRRGRKTTRRRVPPFKNSARLWFYLLFYGVLAVGLAYLVRSGYQTLRSHPEFAVKNMEIAGVSARTESELRADLSDVLGRNLFSLSLKNLKKRVETHIWVDQATVALQMPDKVRIAVRERRPAGIIRVGDRLMLVAESGETICPYSDYGSVLDKPVLVGLTKSDGQSLAVRRGLSTLNQIRQISPFFWENIETLDLSNEENMIVHLRSVDAPVHLGEKVIAANILNYLTIADYVARQYPALRYIELGFPDQIAIMPENP